MSKVLHPPFPGKPRSGVMPIDVAARRGLVVIEFGEQIAGWTLSPEDARIWAERLMVLAETAEEQRG